MINRRNAAKLRLVYNELINNNINNYLYDHYRNNIVNKESIKNSSSIAYNYKKISLFNIMSATSTFD